MAYTRLPLTPLELEELLELDELDEELDVELEELEDELEELEDELDDVDELEELLEDPLGGEVCAPPQAARIAISERGSKCRIFKVNLQNSQLF